MRDSKKIYTVIDVGTNNILLLIASMKSKEIEVLNRKSSISALGKNMKNRILTTSGIYRTKVILKDFINYAKLFTNNIIVVGTSCSRDSKNIGEISNWLWNKYRIKYHILSGKEEARFIGLANIYEFQGEKEFMLFDVGGGSTEFTLIKNNKIAYFNSLKLGIRRLQNKYQISKKEKINQIRSKLSLINIPAKVMVGVGGTATSLAAMKFGLETYNAQIIHKSNISLNDLERIINKIQFLTNRQLTRLLPFDPLRSDIITTGALIFHEILKYFQAEHFYVSDRGLQFGILLQEPSELQAYLEN